MRPRNPGLISASIVFFLVCGGEDARAQIYKYVDETGRIQFTDSYDRVPLKYRAQMEERKQSGTSSRSLSSAISSRLGSAGSAEPDWLERIFADAFFYIAEQDGESMTTVEKRAVEGWAEDWAWAGLWTSTISSLLIMGMVVHAFIADRKMWGIANFLIGFTAIPYLFMHIEKPMAVRLGMFVGVCSPIPVFVALFSRLVATT